MLFLSQCLQNTSTPVPLVLSDVYYDQGHPQISRNREQVSSSFGQKDASSLLWTISSTGYAAQQGETQEAFPQEVTE